MSEKVYGVIAEWKDEAPIIMECYPMTHDDAHQRMMRLKNESNIIRVAMFQMIFSDGNRSLVPEETEKSLPF